MYTAVQIPSGLLGDRFGRTKIILFGFMVFGAATALTHFASSFLMLILIRILAGFGEGFYYGPEYAISSDSTPPKYRALGYAIINNGQAVGITLGLIGSSYISFGLDLGWRVTFMAYAIPTFIVGIISILVTVALACRNVPGSLLIGIVVAVIAGIPLGVTQAPTGIIAPLDFSSIGGPIADAGGVPAIVKVLTDPALLVISFSLLMSDFFDTMGTAMAVAKQGEFLTDDGNVENIKEILIVDSAAAAVGGFMGVSSITTFVESTSGAADGGRTGLTSVTTGVLFILAAFFSPIVTIVSSAATCGALVYVGYLMMSEASEIDWSDVSQGFPAFMIVAGVPFTYSISAGIGLGFIAYVIVALFKGEASKIKPLMWIAALAFLVYFFVA